MVADVFPVWLARGVTPLQCQADGMEDQAQMHQNANRVTPTPGGVVEVECRDLDRDGKGLASWNNWILVIPDLLPGERARVQFQQRQRSRWIARTSNCCRRRSIGASLPHAGQAVRWMRCNL